ncbi:MAG: SCO family protein [Xanthobacteraceae bacterium]
MRSRRLTIACLVAAATLMTVIPAQAHFTASQLAEISAAPPTDAGLPLGLTFRDDSGRTTTIATALADRPAVLIFADYTCRTLCGPILAFAVSGLAKTGLRPGADYRLLVIGINPHDGSDSAHAMRAAHIDSASPINRGAVLLSGDETAIKAAATAVGLNYAYDPEHDQYAHPAAAYIVDANGRVRHLLSPLGLDGSDLRLALVDAGRGAVGNLADQIHLLCYGYDPVKGIYTERITTLLGYAAAGTLVIVAGGIFTMIMRSRRRIAS